MGRFMLAYKYLQKVSNITYSTTTQREYVYTDEVHDIPFLAFLPCDALFDLELGGMDRDEPTLVATLVTLLVITLVTLWKSGGGEGELGNWISESKDMC